MNFLTVCGDSHLKLSRDIFINNCRYTHTIQIRFQDIYSETTKVDSATEDVTSFFLSLKHKENPKLSILQKFTMIANLKNLVKIPRLQMGIPATVALRLSR